MNFLWSFLLFLPIGPDSTNIILEETPAFGYYQSFDTNNVHYWMWDAAAFSDTVKLHLTFDPGCDYFHPIDNAVTSPYGKRRRRMHYGTDVDCETGDAIGVAFEGMVRIAKWNNSYGNIVVVRHPNGLETYYAHLSKLNVSAGQYLQPGDVVGLGGNTGRSYGSHLHFEMRFMGMPINPATLVDFKKKELFYTDIALYKKGNELCIRDAAKYYTVLPGENLYSISRKLNVTVEQLCTLNGWEEDELLLIDAQVRYQ